MREGDERVYQPKIHSDRIRELWKIGQITGRPMTVALDEAIRLYVAGFVTMPQWNAFDIREDEAVDRFMERELERRDREMDQWEDGSLYGF